MKNAALFCHGRGWSAWQLHCFRSAPRSFDLVAPSDLFNWPLFRSRTEAERAKRISQAQRLCELATGWRLGLRHRLSERQKGTISTAPEKYN